MQADWKNEDNGNRKALFGGSISCFLPSNAHDMSNFREIPDNQEVFCHEKTDQSIIFDILEYQDHVQGEEAAKYHFTDIADFNEAGGEAEVTLIEPIPREQSNVKQCCDAWFLLGRQMVSKYKEGADAKNLIHVMMVLYRLPQFQSDILVIMNDPVAISNISSSSSSSLNDTSKWDKEQFKRVACSLTILDTSLFG